MPASEDHEPSTSIEKPPVPTSIRPSSIACIQCGYNLTGVTIGGSCPECGSSIERSLSTHDSPTNGHAIASMVLGICSVILFCGPGVICGILGVLTGLVALQEMKDTRYASHSRGMVIAGMVYSGLGILIFLWFVAYYT